MQCPQYENDCIGNKQFKPLHESETQTSKTILQLAANELESLKSSSLQSQYKMPVVAKEEHNLIQLPKPYKEVLTDRQEFLRRTSPLQHLSSAKEKDVINNSNKGKMFSMPQLSRFTIRKIRIKAVNVSDEESKSPPLDSSPKQENIQSQINVCDLSDASKTCRTISAQSSDIEYNQKDELTHLMTRVKCPDWNTALAAFKEITNMSESCNFETIYAFMPELNQRLIQLLQSPRSHVCRTCCQIAGHFFKTVGDIRRPEFDDIVDLLLSRTADANKFIKIDANIALDEMVNSVPPFHAVRSICNKGTQHKNDLVRISAARLIICVVTLCGPNIIMGHGGNEFTRKRVLTNMVNFINDKSGQVRHYGEELRKLLCSHSNYQLYIKKYLGIKTDNKNEK